MIFLVTWTGKICFAWAPVCVLVAKEPIALLLIGMKTDRIGADKAFPIS